MKAVVCRNTELLLEDVPEPLPHDGHALIGVLRCGICNADLHMRHHCNELKAVSDRVGYPLRSRADRPFIFGHEICGEVLDYGPGCRRKIKPGTQVVAPPVVHWGKEIDLAGFSARSNGGYAERMLLDERALIPVPNGLSPDLAALTEPMAVAWHAVRRSGVEQRDVAVVVGCGSVGLALICLLKARGVSTVVASDISAVRRSFATACGADIVVDPTVQSPFARREEADFVETYADLLGRAASTRETLGKLPLPWWVSWRMAEVLGARPTHPIVFECVGKPGVLQSIIDGAPLFSRIVIIGMCRQPDRIEPAVALQKEVELRFVFGHTPLEYRDALRMIADGIVACEPMLTGVVGLSGVSAAFDELSTSENHAKVLIDPSSSASAPLPIAV